MHFHSPNAATIKVGVVTLLFFLSNSTAANETKWKLIWSDEFNYTGLPDSAKWDYDVGGHGWGNEELQFYMSKRPENARVENGSLIIEARKEQWLGMKYTSARLVTKGKAEWQYGKVAVRAMLPRGRGTWPAIWMLGATTPLRWPDDGEIDIMEHVGFDPGRIHASVHCKKYYFSIGTQKTASVVVPRCLDRFHVYGVEWDQERVRVSVDGRVYFTFKNERSGYEAWPFDNRMYLLLNIAVGGSWGGQKGVDDSVWPQRMTIDYVRVYAKSEKDLAPQAGQ
jgi:beta-glucanase (GH16 family)